MLENDEFFFFDDAKYPQDVITYKKGIHFTEDFICIARLPGVRSTAQNYILECKVTHKRYLCQTISLISGALAQKNVADYTKLL